MKRAGLLLLVALVAGATELEMKKFSGTGSVSLAGVVTDRDGNVYVAGTASALDLPVKNAWQATNAGSALIVSDDGGRTWSPTGFVVDHRYSGVNAPAVYARDSNVLVATGFEGIYRSADGGRSWKQVVGNVNYAQQIAFDPNEPETVYAGSPDGVLKSVDAGLNWTLLTNGLAPGNCCGAGLAVDPFQARRLIYTADGCAYITPTAARRGFCCRYHAR